jgi:hypothetical protein
MHFLSVSWVLMNQLELKMSEIAGVIGLIRFDIDEVA